MWALPKVLAMSGVLTLRFLQYRHMYICFMIYLFYGYIVYVYMYICGYVV